MNNLAVVRVEVVDEIERALRRGDLGRARGAAENLREMVEGGSTVEVRWRVPQTLADKQRPRAFGSAARSTTARDGGERA